MKHETRILWQLFARMLSAICPERSRESVSCSLHEAERQNSLPDVWKTSLLCRYVEEPLFAKQPATVVANYVSEIFADCNQCSFVVK